MRTIEWLPTFIAAFSAFVVGGLWYSPMMFLKAWQKETGLSDEELAKPHKGKVFGISFVLCLIAAAAFSAVMGPEPSFFMALHSGFGIGLAWVATSFGVNYLFESKSLKLWLINAGYHTVQFTIYGLVFGLM